MMRMALAVLSVAGMVAMAPVVPARAMVICSKKSGALVVRAACKKKETVVNLSDFGALGPKGDKGDTGDPGMPGPFPDPLQSGKTLRGTYHVEGGSTYLGSSISYGFTLPSVPTLHMIDDGTTPPAECPGTVDAPEAAPGHLCIYESTNHANNSNDAFLNASVADQGKYGFDINVSPLGASNFWSLGTWAVTAP